VIGQVGTSNVFLVKDGKVYTPPLVGGGEPSDTILEGVTRESCIQVGPRTCIYIDREIDISLRIDI
jgi:branched-subunit amino acid aminotransferase/4-amino-4-deoxychorismate lyase